MPMPCTCALRTAMPEVDVDVDVDGDADDEDLEFDVDGAVDDGVGDFTRCGLPQSFSKEPATALLQIGSRRKSRWTPGVSRTHPTSVHRP